MAAVAGILNHQMTAGQALAAKSATPMASGNSASSTSSSSSDAGTISANDFLTLLVTEMKNQDPTATTDPNEYINQLVNVNSLQQLISINQTLTADSTSSTAATTSSKSAVTAATAAKSPASPTAPAQSARSSAAAAKLAPGNLGVPAANAAASRVAQSLSGRPRLE